MLMEKNICHSLGEFEQIKRANDYCYYFGTVSSFIHSSSLKDELLLQRL